ncbi:MAG: hypothetical protein ACE5IQ_05985 [Candidatus Methylomirabilales bacterium]
MKAVIVMLSLAIIVGSAVQGSEIDRLKSDLIGRTMGGREKGWKFQSPSQIRTLIINDTWRDVHRRVYVITVTLQDPAVPGAYRAEAEVTYERVDSRWDLRGVGLRSLVKIE